MFNIPIRFTAALFMWVAIAHAEIDPKINEIVLNNIDDSVEEWRYQFGGADDYLNAIKQDSFKVLAYGSKSKFYYSVFETNDALIVNCYKIDGGKIKYMSVNIKELIGDKYEKIKTPPTALPVLLRTTVYAHDKKKWGYKQISGISFLKEKLSKKILIEMICRQDEAERVLISTTVNR
jgi:hypothetical protein